LVTDCCKFSIGKVAGSSESEPTCSLVNLKVVGVDPVGSRGRLSSAVKITESIVESIGVAGIACSGRESTQCWRSDVVLIESHKQICIRRRNHTCLHRKSDGFIVLFEEQGEHNPFRGKEPCFVNAFDERRVRRLQWC